MKAIVSVIGKDKKGIIANVATKLSDLSVNIEDISQTIMQDYFTMIMAVETGESQVKFDEIKAQLKKLGEEIGVDIHIQSQSIFDAMHKLKSNNNL